MATGESRGRCAMASVYGVYRVFFLFPCHYRVLHLDLDLELDLGFCRGLYWLELKYDLVLPSYYMVFFKAFVTFSRVLFHFTQ